MIDPRTTNIIGERIRAVARVSKETLAQGVVRVVDYNGASFELLVEVTEGAEWFGVSAGGLIQLSLFDESYEIVVDKEAAGV